MKYDIGLDVQSGKYLRLNYNENFFLPKRFLKNMLRKVINNINIEEMPDANCTKLKKRLAKEHNVSVDNIFIGNGADEVLESLFFLFRKKYKTVNLPRISFKMYEQLADKYDYKIDYFRNLPILKPKINLNELKNKKGLFCFDSPCALNGLSIHKVVLPTLLKSKNNLIIWDNVHGDYNKEPVHLRDNLITIRHFTHFYGLGFLRVGYCIGPKDIIEKLNHYRQPFNVNAIAQIAAIECLDNKKYFYNSLKEINFCKKLFVKELLKLGFQVSKGKTNFIAIQHPDVHAEIIHNLLAKKMIATRYFKKDEILRHYLRITVPPKKGIKKVLSSLKEVVT